MVHTRSRVPWFILISATIAIACLVGVPKVFAADVNAGRLPYRANHEPRTIDQKLKLASDYLAGNGMSQNVNLAVYWYEKAAEAGDPEAELETGYFHDAGIGVPKDASLAVHWYQLAAASGYPRAKVNLATMYLWGTGVARDSAMATQLLQEAAHAGSGLAACYLGNMYFQGFGTAPDPQVARHWYQRGAALKNPQAEYNLTVLDAQLAGQPNDFSRDIALLRSSASAGYVPAIYSLGRLLAMKPALAQTATESINLLHKAEDAGIWQASLVLAILARDGSLTAASPSEAYLHFKTAALLGGDAAEKTVALDLSKLDAALSQEIRHALDEKAAAWQQSHNRVLEFLNQEHKNHDRYPAYALAAPNQGLHALELIPPQVN